MAGAKRPRRAAAALLGAAALAAALLSWAYVGVYLRGGPRIIDATSYWLEARALALGQLAWPTGEPAASTLGRFLVYSDAGGADRVAVLFPPGYPAALALGFLAGAPLVVGPLLAAALVLATWDLAARFFPGEPGARLPLVPALAALFSALSAALRYHTADTMSHGLAALCFTASLTFAARALDAPSPPSSPSPRWLPALLAGLFAGWLAATRPASALALGATLLLWLARFHASSAPPAPPAARAARLRVAALIALGALPGLALLLAHQRAATGAWASSQAAYYAVADGPPGCFRYGFGAGIGCLGEHGDFVRHNLPDGYGALAALKTTLRRLRLHLVDPLNAEPLFALVLAGAIVAWRAGRARLLVIAPLLQIAAYAPFYFDGNYPGGGARFYADVLPLEHALAAAALAAWARRRTPAGTPIAPARWLALAAALPLAGFAVRAEALHAHLRDREGGAPMFDRAALARAGVTRGLVFVDTDHGFNLGHDPDPAAPVQVLRYRGDALDAMAWDARGRPPAYRYRFTWPEGGPAEVRVEPLPLAPPGDELLIEGESLWPPRAQAGAWALPEHAGGTCASAGRWLALHAAPSDSEAVVRVVLPARWLRGAAIAPRVASAGGGADGGAVRLLVDGAALHEWPTPPPTGGPGFHCAWLEPRPIPEDARRVELALVAPVASAPRPPLALDAVRVSRNTR